MRKLVLMALTLVSIILLAARANAMVVTVYTDKTDWKNAFAGQSLTEDFTDSQLNLGVSYISSESGIINPNGYYQDVLQAASQNEPMTTWSFIPQIKGYGGNWTLGGPGGSGNYLRVYINDLGYYVGDISNSYNGEFWGFVSDTPFTSVLLKGGTGTNQQTYHLDDMVYSQVPIPATMLLLGSGLVALAGVRKRFR